ncbi:MAG: hypothetical protein JW753_00345 [Dehalococcoidia bacterium]|nr:hypothetical protein [Dehalococcoidia bacterium]
MSKAATIKNHRILCLVAAAAMVIATVMALIVPRVAQAAESEGITGQFQISNENCTVSEVGLYEADETTAATEMTPQTEYAVKVTVADSGTLADLDTVVVTIFLDDGDDSAGDVPVAGDAQTCCILTCTVDTAPTWDIDAGSPTTWSENETPNDQPSLSAGSGDFWFHFVPGKVATESNDWDIYVVATDDGAHTGTYYDNDPGEYDMLWYGEIDVSGTPPNWGGVLPGMDFSDGSAVETVTANYISNGNYDAAVATTATWSTTAILSSDDTPDANEFALKAWSSDNLTAADLVTTTAGDCVIDNNGALTTEAGDDATNYLYLKLGTPFVDGTYSGTITFHIRNRA